MAAHISRVQTLSFPLSVSSSLPLSSQQTLSVVSTMLGMLSTVGLSLPSQFACFIAASAWVALTLLACMFVAVYYPKDRYFDTAPVKVRTLRCSFPWRTPGFPCFMFFFRVPRDDVTTCST